MNQAEVKRKQIQLYSYAVSMFLLLYFGKMMGNNGLAYFMTGFVTIAFFLQPLAGHVADAVGKMLRYRRKRGMYLNVCVVRKRVSIILAVSSVLCFLLAFFTAGLLANRVFGIPDAELIIRILAVLLLVRGAVSFFQGYFQSFGSQLQTTIAGILRPIFYFIFGKALCSAASLYGTKVAALLKNEDFGGMYCAAGLTVAVVLTELVVLMVMLVFYFVSDRKKDQNKSRDGLQTKENPGETMGAYGRLMGPGVGAGLLVCVIPGGILALLGDMEQMGVCLGVFMVVCALPVLAVGARYYLLYAKIKRAIKGENVRYIREMVQIGLKYAWCVGILFCMLMAVMASQIAFSFFAGDTMVETLLQHGSLLVPAVLLLIYWMLVNVAHHKNAVAFLALALNVVVFILLGVFMKGRMENTMLAVVYAAIISLAATCVGLGMVTVNVCRLQVEYIMTFVLPAACVGIVGLVLMAAGRLLTPHIGNEVCFYLCAALGVVLYLVLLGICRIFMEQDIHQIYGKIGRKCLSVIFK